MGHPGLGGLVQPSQAAGADRLHSARRGRSPYYRSLTERTILDRIAPLPFARGGAADAPCFREGPFSWSSRRTAGGGLRAFLCG